MDNISRATERYIAEHPSVKDCLKRGLINHSSLARLIANDLGVDEDKHFDAILIASRRAKERLKKEPDQQSRILSILKKSRLEIKNKVMAAVIERPQSRKNLQNFRKRAQDQEELCHVIESASAVTIITTDDLKGDIKKSFRTSIIRQHTGLAQIILRSPKELETTSGVIAYLYSLLGENGINIVETMSCWTDTIFLVKEQDVSNVMSLLNF